MKRYMLILAGIGVLLVLVFAFLPGKGGHPRGPAPASGNHFDLIVLGGSPEGIAAAVSASRNGLTVLLAEDDGALGGLMTLGGLSFIDMNFGEDGTLLTQGIFQEFYRKVGGRVFDVERAKQVFQEMLSCQRSITVKLNAQLVEPVVEDDVLTAVKVREGGKVATYYGRSFVDASEDADLAAAAGVPYTVGAEDMGEKDRLMGTTLIFKLKGVSWPKVFFHLNWNRLAGYLKKDSRRNSGATLDAAWGYGSTGFDYQPQDPMIVLRGFNAARQEDGTVLVNALVMLDVDVLDSASRLQARQRAKRELEHLLPYIRENFAGFGKAELAGTAEQLYVRESRHIIGEYVLTIDDVLENRDQWDRVAIGGYPVDIQPSAKHPQGTVVGDPDRYSIPFRSLVPKRVDNLLVVGRSASYSSLAAGSARVIPVGMSTGQAAGAAAAYSLGRGITFRRLAASPEAIGALQQLLISQGAYLEPFNVDTPLTRHRAYDGLKVLRRMGILAGGYNNDYRLEETISKLRFENLVNNALKKADSYREYIEVPEQPGGGDILLAAARALGYKPSHPGEAAALLQEAGILTKDLAPYFTEMVKRPQAAEVIMLVANLFKYLEN